MEPTPESDLDGRPERGRPRPFPVLLHLEGAPCLVVGAGPVAARKVRGLLDAGAAVTVVAPAVGAGVRAIAEGGVPSWGSLTVELRAYSPPEAAGYRLVVSATGDPAVDAAVVADAVAGGALVNRADSPPPGGHRPPDPAGTVLVPAVHRDGPVTVAVSTDGSSPALARWLRDRLAAGLDGARLPELATLVEQARVDALASGAHVDRDEWAAALDRVAPLVADGRTDEARRVLAQLVAGPGR